MSSQDVCLHWVVCRFHLPESISGNFWPLPCWMGTPCAWRTACLLPSPFSPPWGFPPRPPVSCTLSSPVWACHLLFWNSTLSSCFLRTGAWVCRDLAFLKIFLISIHTQLAIWPALEFSARIYFSLELWNYSYKSCGDLMVCILDNLIPETVPL